MAEIYSTGALFNLTQKQNLIYKAFTILTIRFFIWYKLFMCSFLQNAHIQVFNWLSPLIISIGMFCLDLYWLKEIYTKLKKSAF